MTFIKRSDEYWERRAEEQLTRVEKDSLKHLRQIDRAYLDARKYTLKEVKTLYLAYYKKQGWDTTELRQIVPRGDIRRFREAVAEAGLIDKLPEGYGFRLNRLEMVEANLWLESQKAVKSHVAYQTAAHLQTIDTGYHYAAYNLAKGTGVSPAFAQLNTRTINRILNTKFQGSNYSQRIWKNGDYLAKTVKAELASAMASGQSYTKTAKNIKERYGVTRYQASRLVRTETNYFNTQATSENYESIGIDQFVYLATLDGRTSEICGSLDNKRFNLDQEDMKPPQHPNCRSTVRAYLGEEYEPDERIMRDPKTGKNRIVSQMSYDEYRKLYL